jgi:hypothetical protein
MWWNRIKLTKPTKIRNEVFKMEGNSLTDYTEKEVQCDFCDGTGKVEASAEDFCDELFFKLTQIKKKIKEKIETEKKVDFKRYFEKLTEYIEEYSEEEKLDCTKCDGLGAWTDYV